MPVHALGPRDGLYYEHTPPARPDGLTFVFFNALTGDTAMWTGGVVPALTEAGHGFLAYNLRGQRDSPFASPEVITPANIVADACALLAEVQPQRPVLVGLSIGGLFAAQAWLAGAEANALVLVNTLRRDGPRLRWVSDATVRAVEVGGPGLLRDLLTPLLFGESWLGAHRAEFLAEGPYTPIDRDSGPYHLLRCAREADWDVPYERLTLPVLVVSGMQDRVFFDAPVVEALVSRMPDARRVDLPDVGHLVPAERPEALSRALLELAARL